MTISHYVLDGLKKLVTDDRKLITYLDDYGDAGMTSSGIASNMAYSIYNQFYSYNQTIKTVKPFYYHYLVMAMVDAISEDSMIRDPITSRAFDIEISKENKDKAKLEAEIRAFQRDFDIDKLVSDNLYNAIFYGEYPFRLKVEEKKGVTAIIDNIEPGEVISLLKNGVPVQYYEFFKDRFRASPPWKYWSLMVTDRRMRIETSYTFKLPYKLSVPRPFIVPVLPQLMELMVIETAKVGRKIIDMLRSNLVGVQAPKILSLQQLKDFKRFYEKILNDTGGFSGSTYLSGMDISEFERLLQYLNSKSSQLTVVPYQDERGRIEPITARDQGMEIPQSDIEDKRNSITSAAGVPYEYVLGRRDEKFAASYRAYVRYTKKILSVQQALAWSVRRLMFIHLKNKGENIRLRDIEVNFYNKITTSELDRLEFLDTEVAMLSNLTDFLDRLGMMDGFSRSINPRNAISFIQNSVSIPALKAIFQMPKLQPPPEEGGGEGEGEDEEA